jgi:hypothetical protein
MRGADTKQASMLCLLSPEDRVPKKCPLRGIKKLADQALAKMSPLFDERRRRTAFGKLITH